MQRMLIAVLVTLGAINLKQEVEVFVDCDKSPSKYLKLKWSNRQIRKNIRQFRKEGDVGRAAEAIYLHNLTEDAFRRI